LTEKSPLTLTVYTADAWEHVCPVVRITGPARQAGVRVIHGNEWEMADGVRSNGSQVPRLSVYPERVADGDLVVIQRDFPCLKNETEPDPYEQVMSEARRLGKRVVYELDDLLPELPLDHPGARRYLPGRLSILRAIVEADAVVGSTPKICEYLGNFNNHVLHLPNYLDDSLWQLRLPIPEEIQQTRSLVIGYLGSASHLADLVMIEPVLQRLLERHPNTLILRFWGLVPPPSLRELPNVEWNPVGLVAYRDFARFFNIQDCDLAIAPLQDNGFNRAKSPIKFLEYSTLGIPGVYSYLEPYTQVVKNGENGLLAGSLDEWEKQLTAIIEDSNLRVRLGAAAQETVRREWLLSEHATGWGKAYQQILGSPFAEPKINSAIIKAQAWQKELETSSRQLAQELEQRNREYGQATALYQDLVNSTGWKFSQKLTHFQRRLAPPGSWRGRLLRLGFYALLVLQRAGLKGFLRGSIQKLRSSLSTTRRKNRGAPASLPAIFPSKTLFLPGVKLSLPAISVVLIQEAGRDEPKLGDVLAWLHGQTIDISAVEVVIWDRPSSSATAVGNPTSTWAASNGTELVHGLHGRYICLAYPDLLQQNSSYLEANWIVLETGNLAFTVNLRGSCTWADGYLDAGFIPGLMDQPLFRLVIDKTCLAGKINTNDQQPFYWDVTAWTEGQLHDQSGFPWAVAKVIHHASPAADIPGILTFSNHLPAGQWQRKGAHLLARTAGDGPWPEISVIIHPVESYHSAKPRLSEETTDSVLTDAVRHAHASTDRPTVLIAMQYLAVGGAEQLALNIIKELNDRVRFVVFSVDPMDLAQATLADAFRQVTPYVYTPPDFLEAEQRLSFYFSLIERFQPNSLYIANGAEAIYAALGEIRKRYPRLRTINQVYDSQVGWIHYYDLRLLKHLDAHIGANSQICQAYLEKGARPDSVFQIPHTIDLDSLDPLAYPEERIIQLRQLFGIEPADTSRVAVFASRAHPQKRPLDFIEVARRFTERNDPPVHFLMFSEGPLEEQIDAAINQVNAVQTHQPIPIRRLPFHRPISDVLAMADVLVLPSEFEGMPLIVAEAQAMGKPVVVTDVGNNREVLAVTGGGVLAPVGEVQALYLGVQEMLAQPPDPTRLRKAIIEHFSPQVIAEQYRQVLLPRGNDA
jgi:processive 1,2-diacylglycerol beta-glucosyltransferase